MPEMILRSLYLRQSEDAQLRQLAHDLGVTKADLIRSAVAIKLKEWLASDHAAILADVENGKRDVPNIQFPAQEGASNA